MLDVYLYKQITFINWRNIQTHQKQTQQQQQLQLVTNKIVLVTRTKTESLQRSVAVTKSTMLWHHIQLLLFKAINNQIEKYYRSVKFFRISVRSSDRYKEKNNMYIYKHMYPPSTICGTSIFVCHLASFSIAAIWVHVCWKTEIELKVNEKIFNENWWTNSEQIDCDFN